jgi:Tfp pilus assembly protein PilF
MGMAYQRTGDRKAARAAYQRALAADPGNTYARLLLETLDRGLSP